MAARKGGPPPPELRLFWWCTDGRLPLAGGVHDQDFVELHTMNAAGNIYRVIKKMENLKGAQIHSLSRGDRLLMKYLREEALWDG